ncbi:MAG TPA: hypothetical protein VK712_03600 [Verrucomicrobiae bacterium]|jgi:hypothetical protein|nr:hypothetical protein [Verrucomicrobiae bacterium]
MKPSSKIHVGDEVAEAINTLMSALYKKGWNLDNLTIDGQLMTFNELEDHEYKVINGELIISETA